VYGVVDGFGTYKPALVGIAASSAADVGYAVLPRKMPGVVAVHV
jgi:hypothetical protein